MIFSVTFEIVVLKRMYFMHVSRAHIHERAVV